MILDGECCEKNEGKTRRDNSGRKGFGGVRGTGVSKPQVEPEGPTAAQNYLPAK